MGLSYDPNQSLKIPNVKSALLKSAKRKASGDLSSDDEPVKKRIPKKVQVSQELESIARAPRQRLFRLPKGQVLFLTNLMNKYGEDYEAMARDKKNHYQLTWRQIRQKINTFKNIPEQYAEFLVQSGEIVLDDPTSLEETRKQLAAENVAKFCVSKKVKKVEKKTVIGAWIEEDKEEEMFETEKTLEDDEEDLVEKVSDENKLKLFSDDEDDVLDKEEDVKRKKTSKADLLEKSPSSDSEDSEEFDDENDGVGFKDLEDMSDEELSEDDILDDGEFVTDSDEDNE